jgi:hypothetical protein
LNPEDFGSWLSLHDAPVHNSVKIRSTSDKPAIGKRSLVYSLTGNIANLAGGNDGEICSRYMHNGSLSPVATTPLPRDIKRNYSYNHRRHDEYNR